jgi:hypothetical protein
MKTNRRYFLPLGVETGFATVAHALALSTAAVAYLFRWPVRRMRRSIFVALLVAMAVTGATTPPQDALIEKHIERLVALFSDGVAVSYPKFQRVTFGNIFGSSRSDAVALFNIEGFHGGNYHAEYLAFFEAVEQDHVASRTTQPFRLVAVTQIGGRGWRCFDRSSVKLAPGCVKLSGNKYGPQDPMSSPSVPIQITFHVKAGFISESK